MNIFISHKHEDAETALILKTKLEALGGGRIECFVSEHIPYGADWFERIRDSLKGTDVLLLIFTAADRTWDWPLYEVGLATNLEDLDECKIVTLYPPGAKPPEPIKHVQAVEATEQGIKNLIVSLFCTCDISGDPEPINPRLANDDELVSQFAREFSARFQATTPWEHCFTYFFWLSIKDGNMEREEVPRDARIDPASTALSLFELSGKPPREDFWTWQGILDTFARSSENTDLQWAKDLGERLYWASKGSTLKETRSTLVSPKTGEVYRPLLHRAKLRSDGSMLFEIILVKHYTLGSKVDAGRAGS